ncbi:PLP-dependent aminotransferase family protein [Myroides sp. LoEW2-1]|uniref:MocR-like pyridoxine biosynthesis transcription factor PdxR n=1 Tax=Myroides sp. LoEW2-1 TaxID=2683192 RepID=UPI001324B544|nr:PLP-dependent aminotransferase family protein [Myroides sp. LoEW2-1]MVX37296.1 aminotransferase class I/II-fold pyridoxal phosphate-dependent enzyme [Myroides sp. LoEW2-1]
MLRPWKLNIEIDGTLDKPIYLQIADAIIQDITLGRLKSGTALPGSRVLAAEIGVNRNTVVEALNVLIAEKWLDSKERRGTFVAEELPVLDPFKKEKNSDIIKNLEDKSYWINFNDGHSDSRLAPVDELARAYRKIFKRKAKWQLMGYADTYGQRDFRQAIADMLNHQRSMYVQADHICITRGSQMALYLLAHCLWKKGDIVIVEDLGYKPAWQAFETVGVTLLSVGVDKEGLKVDEVSQILNKYKGVKAVYTTPHHQYPTTVVMSTKRRLELIALSNEHNFTIIEDDYDNEFHYGYRPVMPLCSNKGLRDYIYIGTLSKVVAPALRIGYLVTKNQELLRQIGNLRKLIDVQGDVIMEQAILQLIQEGTIKKHLRKVSQIYNQRRDTMKDLIERYLKDYVNYSVPEGGLAFWLEYKTGFNHKVFEQSVFDKGIKLISSISYSFDNKSVGFRLSFGNLEEEEMKLGIIALANCFKETIPDNG